MPVVSPPTIAALPTPPSTASPANFDTRADAFLGALPAFQAESNAVATNVFANATDAATSASTATTQAGTATTQAGIATTQAGIATTQAGIATTQAGNAATSAASAATAGAIAGAGASGAVAWVSGTTYAQGFTVYSLVNFQTYRRKVAGAGTTDPSLDGVNWAALVSPGNHEVVVHTGNGNGSTNNRIRRFTTTLTNVGTAITYSDSATLGASFTINEDGLYSFHYGESSDTGGSPYEFGVSLNSAQLTTTISSINIANRLAYAVMVALTGATSPLPNTVSRVVRLTAGDVVRAHGTGSPGTTNAVFFAITKVGV